MSLFYAAQVGSTSRCRQLLASGSDARERDKAGWTPLLVAAYCGHADVCDLLLAAGSDVGERSKSDHTPLLLAADNGHTEVCEMLLERGKANFEETTPLGNTALNLAATKGDVSTVALLLSKGAKVDTRNKSGWTPLLVAAQKSHTEVCELLLTAGSDVEESVPKTQFTSLHFAALHGHGKIIQLLLSQLQKANINSRSRTEYTPLICASSEGHLACVLTLLQAGADPLLANNYGSLPIHMAAKHNHHKVVRILIEEGGCSPDQVRHTALQSLDHLYNYILVKQLDYHDHDHLHHCQCHHHHHPCLLCSQTRMG